ncbi:MAG: DUF4835 family protein [Bacteroidota bacterium]
MKQILLVLFLAIGPLLSAQELNFQVSVNTPQLATTDPKVFESLEGALNDFLNNQKWTNDVFEPEERINCNIQITIKEEVSTNSFKADMAIQAVRPVYGSNYETPVVTHIDKDVSFEYEPFQPIVYSRNVFNDNLSSIISFYIYVVLGMDYDTFGLFGGDEYFQIAQDILNAVPPATAARFPGWRALDGRRNRYWIVENMTAPGLRGVRRALYSYHRQGLDIMANDVATGRVILTQALEDIQQANRNYPNSMAVRLFMASKTNELLEIFKESPSDQKNKVRDVMSKLDASNASRFRRALGR